VDLPFADEINPKESHCYVIIPEIFIQHYAQQLSAEDIKEFPFFNYIRQHIDSFVDKGKFFEHVGMKCLIDRFQSPLIDNKVVGTILPFLSDTCVVNNVFTSKDVYKFPK